MKKLQIERLVLGELDTNCYLAWEERSLATLIVDPADSGDVITERILELQLQPQAIVLTHGHFDHVLGLLELSLNFPVPVYIHRADLFLLKQAADSARHWLKRRVLPVPLPRQFLADGDELTLGALKWQVIDTPGHTPGSMCLYQPEEQVIFTGDTLFHSAIGRTDFRYSDPSLMKKSLATLGKLPPGTMVLPGHGQPTSIGAEVNFTRV